MKGRRFLVGLVVASASCGFVLDVPQHAEVPNIDADGKCLADFADCDGAPENGCETSLANDDQHCGACDNACGAGSRCVDHACNPQLVVSDPAADGVEGSTIPFTVTGRSLFFIHQATGALYEVSLDDFDANGDHPIDVATLQPLALTTLPISPDAMASNADRVFWGDSSFGAPDIGKLFTASLGALDQQQTVWTGTTLDQINVVTLDDTYVYWVIEHGYYMDVNPVDTVWRAPLADLPNATPEQLFTVKSPNAGPLIPEFVVGEKNIYWTEYEVGADLFSAWTCDKTSCAATTTKLDATDPIGVAVADGRYCVGTLDDTTTGGSPAIFACGEEGQPTTTSINVPFMSPVFLAFTGTSYATIDLTGQLVYAWREGTTSCAVQTSCAQVPTNGAPSPPIFSAAGDVYWATPAGVYRWLEPLAN